MKSAFRIANPPGSSGPQALQLTPLLGHPGVVKELIWDFTFNGRNNAAAISTITARSGNGGGITAIPITLTYPSIIAASAVAEAPFPEQPSGTTGNDDIDNLLNAFFGGAGNNWILNIGVGRILFDQQTAVMLRTLLSPLSGGNDIISRTLIDFPLLFPSSGSGVQAYSFQMIVPLSLAEYIRGGECTAQGTASLRDGSFTIPLSNPASFVNAAGATINLTGFLATLFGNYSHEGDGSWVGPSWRSFRQAYGGNNPTLKSGHYVWISDSSTQTAATIGGAGWQASTVTTYNFHGQWNGDQITIGMLRADWKDSRTEFHGSYDVGERTVPILTMLPDDQFEDLPFAPNTQNIDASSGTVTNVVLLTVELIPKNPGITAQVAAQIGGGGATTYAFPRMKSGDKGIDKHQLGFAPTIRKAGSLPGGMHVPNPTQAGQITEANTIAGTSRAAQIRKG